MNCMIETLDRTHDRTTFDCGDVSLNDFIIKFSTQYSRKRVGKTYVLVAEGQKQVLGYYTVAAYSIDFEEWPEDLSKKLPRHPISVILLGRFAVDRTLQGQGQGTFLLQDALTRCLAAQDIIGVHAVFVEAIDLNAAKFYERFGFSSLKNNPLKLYLRIETIEKSRGI